MNDRDKIAEEIKKAAYTGIAVLPATTQQGEEETRATREQSIAEQVSALFHIVKDEYDKLKKLNSNDLVIWAGANGRIAAIDNAATNNLDNNIKSAAIALGILIRNETTVFDLNESGHSDIIQTLVTGIVISGTDQDDLTTLATVKQTLAQSLGIRAKVGHVEEALRFNRRNN